MRVLFLFLFLSGVSCKSSLFLFSFSFSFSSFPTIIPLFSLSLAPTHGKGRVDEWWGAAPFPLSSPFPWEMGEGKKGRRRQWALSALTSREGKRGGGRVGEKVEQAAQAAQPPPH
jgi:hypothetical protein